MVNYDKLNTDTNSVYIYIYIYILKQNIIKWL